MANREHEVDTISRKQRSLHVYKGGWVTLEERELKLIVPLWPLDDTSMLPLIRPFISRHSCSSLVRVVSYTSVAPSLSYVAG